MTGPSDFGVEGEMSYHWDCDWFSWFWFEKDDAELLLKVKVELSRLFLPELFELEEFCFTKMDVPRMLGDIFDDWTEEMLKKQLN